jgi:chromatin remodeling complex protein RSC6
MRRQPGLQALVNTLDAVAEPEESTMLARLRRDIAENVNGRRTQRNTAVARIVVRRRGETETTRQKKLAEDKEEDEEDEAQDTGDDDEEKARETGEEEEEDEDVL